MTEENLEASLKEDTSTQVLYDQLQSEYNKLLKQYAAAENTIDELRTGATVHLYTEPVESRPTSRLSFESGRYPQNINFPRPLQASTSEFSTMNDTCSTNFSTGGRIKTPTEGERNDEHPSLVARIQTLKEDVNAVESVFSESGAENEKVLNELLVICKQLDEEREILSRQLKLQSRNAVSSSSDNVSTKTELQKELHRIGLHIEEIQGDIIARLKTKMHKHAAVRLPQNDEKPPNDEKPTLSRDLQNLVREMKDLKDASIRNSDDLLNSSKMENTQTGNVLPNRRHSEPKADALDSRYFTASPVNVNYLENTFLGSDCSEDGDEHTLNMTWPPLRNMTDADIGSLRHSYSETSQRYGRSVPDKTRNQFLSSTHHSASSPSGQNTHNNERPRKDHYSANSPKTSSHSSEPRQFELNQHRAERKPPKSEKRHPLNSYSARKHTPYSEEENGHDSLKSRCSEHERRHEQERRNYEDKRDDFVNTTAQSPCSSQETLRNRSDLDRPNHEKNQALNSTRLPPGSGKQAVHEKDKRLPKQPGHERQDYLNTRNYPPCSDEETRKDHHTQTSQRQTKNQSHERRVGSPDFGARTFHSTSSLADSSRMSTPLFQPRGATRLSTRGTQAPRYKQRAPSDGFDSGFVGSEASRSSRVITDHPDGEQKLNISNTWDSSLHLDLVSEIDENEATSSPEQMSTTYEVTTECGRESPRERTNSEINEDIKFINSSPRPSLSTERSPMTHTGYVNCRTSQNQLPSNSDNSSPVPNTVEPLLSPSSERPSLERRCSTGSEETSRTRVDRRRISQGGSGSRDVSPKMTADIRGSGKTERRTNEHNSARKLQSLRNELDSLHDHVNKLQNPRVTMEMYDELRDYNDQLRRTYERRHERKLNELRQIIEQLKKDVKSRKDQRKPERDSEFYDDFRTELRKVTDKLDELSALRNTPERPPESTTTYVVPSKTYGTYHDEEMAKRFSNLVRKVDELRHSVENRRDNFDYHPATSRHFCRLCYEADVHHHGNGTVNTTDHQPHTSTPFVSDVYRQRKETAKSDHRPYLSSTFPGARLQQTPVIHHIHTYHKGPELQDHHATDSDDENYVSRTPRQKSRVYRSRYRARPDFSYRDHLSLDEAHKAAWEVQRLSKNILNTISLDLTSLRS